ncbi:acyl carrier protein [Vibrio sp. S9_S30]|uniref:acyl carrier protein n=1 Tax=Vibrio sp. S9_S30 TaxID=2720226 RepID=UPI0016812A0E|nr:acyl carrier protein [Vibrio sp. S9_S30]MBD1556599.1 acyl carrier protein [Vibrio sp. S9_S30]
MLFNEVSEILVEVLGVEPEEVTEQANLVDDLAAESIDFVDIIYSIEQKYQLKISAGDIFPAFLQEGNFLNSEGKVSDEIISRLRSDYPHYSDSVISEFINNQSADVFFRVDSLVKFVSHKQAA